MPLHMRLPKLKGFKNPFRTEYQVVNLDRLAELFPEGGDGRRRRPGRPGRGPQRTSRSRCSAPASSASRCRSPRTRSPARAKEKIAAAGGSVTELLERPGVVTATGGALGTPGRRRPVVRATAPGQVRAGSVRARLLSPAAVAVHRHQYAVTDRPPVAGRAGGAVLTAFVRAFRTPDLRKKLLFTLAIIALLPARLASCPTPGRLLRRASRRCLDQVERRQRPLRPVNLFSGGALLQLSVFALGIMPYITAEHHPAAARRGDPAARAAEEGGPGRPGEAHAVHPLPDHRPGDPAVHRLRRAGPLRAAVPRAASDADRSRTTSLFTDRSCMVITHDRRHRA